MEIRGTRTAPEARLALAAATVALLALLLAQVWRPVLILPDRPSAPLLNGPATAAPVERAPVPLTSAAPVEITAVPTFAPRQAPASIAPSSIAPAATPIRSSPPLADPSGAGAPNFLAPADGEPPAVPQKVPPPPKG